MSDLEETATIKFWVNDPGLDQLEKRNYTDGGFDIRCADHSVVIPARESTLVHTALRVAIPKGYVGLIKSRSGIATKSLVEVGAGVIDSDYRGEICVLLHNHSDDDITFQYGDRVAQLCVVPVLLCEPVKVEVAAELGQTRRGENGFGSTGLG